METTTWTNWVTWIGDAEWKKVVESKAKKERPGKDFYKSDAEIAAIKAANKAQETTLPNPYPQYAQHAMELSQGRLEGKTPTKRSKEEDCVVSMKFE